MGWPEVTLIVVAVIGVSAPLTAKYLGGRKTVYTDEGHKCATSQELADMEEKFTQHHEYTRDSFHRLAAAVQQLCNSTGILVDRGNRGSHSN